MEERPPIWMVAANKLNKQSRTADKGWSSSLEVGRGFNNASPSKPMLRNIHKPRSFLWRKNDPEVNYSPTRTLMEEHRLRVFENRVLRTVFGSKRDEVTG